MVLQYVLGLPQSVLLDCFVSSCDAVPDPLLQMSFNVTTDPQADLKIFDELKQVQDPQLPPPPPPPTPTFDCGWCGLQAAPAINALCPSCESDEQVQAVFSTYQAWQHEAEMDEEVLNCLLCGATTTTLTAHDRVVNGEWETEYLPFCNAMHHAIYSLNMPH